MLSQDIKFYLIVTLLDPKANTYQYTTSNETSLL